MIALDLPAPLLWALRWLLFLGPLGAAAFLVWRARDNRRVLVGALFAFLYGLGLIFVTHEVAIASGAWRFGGDTLMLAGIPADIWIGGALLFGPVLALAFPALGPFWLTLPIILGLHGTVFSSLKPLVFAGPGWFAAIVLVFLTTHIPAIYLARWTAADRHLPARAALLALGYGCLAFIVLPSLIMHAMGGAWDFGRPPAWIVALCLPAFGICMLVGLAAVQSFVIDGHGTAVPLDPTRRLVRTGLFAYLSNPMQAATAFAWIVLGIALANPWIAAGAVMAWVFVRGMVRWHHRNDLLVRFPVGWPEYRRNVPEWLPRWRPWAPVEAVLRHGPQDRFAAWLGRRNPAGLRLECGSADAGLTYGHPDEESRTYRGVAAAAKALQHVNFGYALLGALVLLAVLPTRALVSAARRRDGPLLSRRHG